MSVSWDKTGKKHCGKKLQEVSLSWDETGEKHCGKKLQEVSLSWDETGKKHCGKKLQEVSVSWDETLKSTVECKDLELNALRHDREGGVKKYSSGRNSKSNSDIESECLRLDMGFQVSGDWTEEEGLKSSTWREAEAIYRVIKSNAHILKNSSVKIHTDNKNVPSVLLNGSSKNDLQIITVSLRSFCDKNGIILSIEWMPREENQIADHLSRCRDSDDWSVSKSCFVFLDKLWGKHTVDRFSSHYNAHCPRFNSRWWVPNTEAVDAFDQLWYGENNWLVPPPGLVVQCLNKLEKERATGTLVVPKWKSAPYWPLLCDKYGNFNHFVLDHRLLPRYSAIKAGKGNNGTFQKSPLQLDLIAVRIDFTM